MYECASTRAYYLKMTFAPSRLEAISMYRIHRVPATPLTDLSCWCCIVAISASAHPAAHTHTHTNRTRSTKKHRRTANMRARLFRRILSGVFCFRRSLILLNIVWRAPVSIAYIVCAASIRQFGFWELNKRGSGKLPPNRGPLDYTFGLIRLLCLK